MRQIEERGDLGQHVASGQQMHCESVCESDSVKYTVDH